MSSIREKLAEKRTKLAVPRERIQDHPADLNQFREGSFLHIPVDEIHANPAQPRQYFDAESLVELAESIRQKGVLQPVIVRRAPDGRIFLVAGERRLRAAKDANLQVIPAVVTEGDSAEIALIENLQREDLKPIEEADALARMVEEHGYTQEQLARIIGKGRTTVTESLSLAKLPEAIKEDCRRADHYPRRLLVEIAKQPTSAAMVALFEQVKQRNLKSDGLRKITRAGRPGARRPALQMVIERIERLTPFLERVRPHTLPDEDQVRLFNALRDLKRAMDGLLE